MSDRTYIEIPGNRTHELPPLLIHGEPAANATPLSEVMDLAAGIVEGEDMIPFLPVNEDVAERHELGHPAAGLGLAPQLDAVVEVDADAATRRQVF